MKNGQEGQTNKQTERQALRQTAGHRTEPFRSLEEGRGWLFGLFLIIVTMAAYQPAWHGGFIWDDYCVPHNLDHYSLHGLSAIWLSPAKQYYPLAFTTCWLEYHIWGFNTLGYHLVNILLHALNAVLLWIILRRLSVPGAWLAAAIFALHPVNVESVAWISERRNTLSGFFYLCSLVAALKFWLPQETAIPGSPPERLKDWKFYWLAFALFLCALFSKTTTLPLPMVVLLLVWWKREKIVWRDICPLSLFLAAGIAMGLITRHVEGQLGAGHGSEFEISLVDRCLIAGRDLWFYLGKLFWPHPLMFVYPRWKIAPSPPLAWLSLLAVAAVLFILWFKRKSWGRPVFVALAYFFGLLFVMLGFFNICFFLSSFVADHFQYLACMGPIALVAAGTTLAFNHWGRVPAPFLAAAQIIFAICLLAVLGTLTWKQCSMYANEETLWKMTIARNPACWVAYNNLGIILSKKGQVDEAMANFQKSLETNPDYPEAHYNLGIILSKKGRLDEAIVNFQKSLEINPDEPDIQDNLGATFFQKGEVDKAMACFKKSLETYPDDAEAHYNLGCALFLKGRLDEAITHFQRALEINPSDPDAWNDLGVALLQKGRLDEAMAHFQKTLELDPDNVKARNHLAWLLATSSQASLRNGNKAVELAQRANRLMGDGNPVVLGTLAAAYAEAGRFPEAVETAQQAVQLAEAQSNLRLANALRFQMKLYQAGQPFHLH